MNSRLLVNKSIIKSDLRRYWYLGALYAVSLILTTALPLANTTSPMLTYEGKMAETFIDSRFASYVSASVFPVFIFSILIPAIIFSYLHHKSAVASIHSLPLKRSSLYLSHLVSAAAYIFGAIAVCAVIMMTACDVSVSYVLIWAGLSAVYSFLIASFSAMASTLVGNIAAGVLFPCIIAALPMFVIGVADFLCSNYLYGYLTPDAQSYIIEHIYLDYELMLKGWLLMYIAAGILFLILGHIAYKKRALENNSRVVAFDFLNPIFMYGFAVCLGFSGYAYIRTITEFHAMWTVIPFGIAGIIIAKMLIDKSFKPKGFVVPAIVYCLMMCVVYLFVGVDITGYEKRIPHMEEIASVDVTNTSFEGSYAVTFTTDNTPLFKAEKSTYDPTVYDKADIEKIAALHKAITTSGEEGRGDLYITINYTLNNGKHFKRNYWFNSGDELLRLYADVQTIDSVKAYRFPVLDNAEKEYTWATVNNMNKTIGSLTNDQINELVEALKKDISNATFYDYFNKGAITCVTLDYRFPVVLSDGTPVEDRGVWGTGATQYNIYPCYTNAIALLNQWGMYHKMPTADDVKQISVMEETEEESFEEVKSTEDKAEISRILNCIRDNEDKFCGTEYSSAAQRISILYSENDGGWNVSFSEKIV